MAARESDRATRPGSSDPPSGPVPPTIPGYSRLEYVSKGGQAYVFSAIQDSTRRKVAVKVSRDGGETSAVDRRRFEREVELIGAMRHPNVVAIFDSGATRDGAPYYVMDFVEGAPLDRYVRDHRLATRAVVELFAKVADAVAYAHQRGVIHRDLKPGNVLVSAEGRPFVLDFGLAKRLLVVEDGPQSQTGAVVGTLPYLAPEQARGASHEVDTRTDVYALGRVLYELLAGQPPYPTRGSYHEIFHHVESTPPARMPRSIGRDLESVLLRSLEKSREDRYQSAGEFAADLRRWLAGDPVDAMRRHTGYVLRKILARSRRAAAAVAAVAIGLVATIVILALVVHAQQLRHRNDLQERVHQTELDESPAGIVRYDPSGQATYANRQAARMTGATQAELLAQNWKRGIDAWKRSGLESIAQDVERTRVAQMRVVTAHHSTFGRDMSFEGKFLPAREDAGLMLTMIDRMDLRRLEQVASRVATAADRVAFVVDLDHDRVVLANSAARELADAKSETEVANLSASAFLGDDALLRDARSSAPASDWRAARLARVGRLSPRELAVDWLPLLWTEAAAVAVVETSRPAR